MTEIELKFQVPDASEGALRRALQTATARTQTLRALYLDTPDAALAAAGLAWRLRREGRAWVQALKGRGDGVMTRLEHELPRGAAAAVPVPDAGLHVGTPAGDALLAALAAARQPGQDRDLLQARYEIRVQRLSRVLRTGGARIELALDVGEIRAGAARLPVCELEFELLAGPPQALLDLAARWSARHGLWLDVRTKAERGESLARCQPGAGRPRGTVPAGSGAGAATAAVDTAALAHAPVAALPVRAVLARMLMGSLAQLLSPAARLAAEATVAPLGDGARADAVHAWRVGLRRVRSLLRVFGGALAADGTPAATALQALDARLSAAAAWAGDARERDAWQDLVRPVLDAAGLAMPAWPPLPPGPDLAAQLRGPAWTALVLDLLGVLLAAAADTDLPGASAQASPPVQALGRWLPAQLERQRRRLRRDAAVAADLDVAGRHAARKRVKRLRYALEAAAALGLLRPRRLRRQLALLKAAQTALGEANDLAALAPWLAALAVEARPPASSTAEVAAVWFLRGWCQATRPMADAAAVAALQALDALPASRLRTRVAASPGP